MFVWLSKMWFCVWFFTSTAGSLTYVIGSYGDDDDDHVLSKQLLNFVSESKVSTTYDFINWCLCCFIVVFVTHLMFVCLFDDFHFLMVIGTAEIEGMVACGSVITIIACDSCVCVSEINDLGRIVM